MICLQEEASPARNQQTGQGSRNDHTNNMGQFTFSQQGNQPIKSTPPGSKKTKQESGRCHPPKRSFNTSISPNTKQTKRKHNQNERPEPSHSKAPQDEKNHKYQDNLTRVEQNHGILKKYPMDWQLVQPAVKQPL